MRSVWSGTRGRGGDDDVILMDTRRLFYMDGRGWLVRAGREGQAGGRGDEPSGPAKDMLTIGGVW